jgi:hypothetical protein
VFGTCAGITNVLISFSLTNFAIFLVFQLSRFFPVGCFFINLDLRLLLKFKFFSNGNRHFVTNVAQVNTVA